MESNELIRIVNMRQASMYIKNGCKPVDMEYTDRLVFVFNKKESQRYYDLWCKYELQ